VWTTVPRSESGAVGGGYWGGGGGGGGGPDRPEMWRSGSALWAASLEIFSATTSPPPANCCVIGGEPIESAALPTGSAVSAVRALPTTFRSANIRATWRNVSSVAPYAENRATINVMHAETTTYADLRI